MVTTGFTSSLVTIQTVFSVCVRQAQRESHRGKEDAGSLDRYFSKLGREEEREM